MKYIITHMNSIGSSPNDCCPVEVLQSEHTKVGRQDFSQKFLGFTWNYGTSRSKLCQFVRPKAFQSMYYSSEKIFAW